MEPFALDRAPGFRRCFRITPATGRVSAAVEDDYHCMRVIVRHDGERATAVEAVMERAPWSTCPGAQRVLQETFTGELLADFAERGESQAHCTHLYDLVQLAAVHALDSEPTEYEILVADPIDGKRHAEIRSGGEALFNWAEADFHLLEPEILAGTRLDKLGPWIRSLPPPQQEAARLLRWGTILAHGRGIPMEQQSDATRMPPNCYTFQPLRAQVAQRVGEIYDFSEGNQQPLSSTPDH